MTEGQGVGDYPDYVKHRSNLISVFALLSGFTFTATTLLVTRLPEPGSMLSQLVLLFSAVLLDLFIFLLTWNTTDIVNYFVKIPSPTKVTNAISLLTALSIGFWGMLLPLIFFLWDLLALGFVTTVIWALFFVLGITVVWRPFEKRRRRLFVQSKL